MKDLYSPLKVERYEVGGHELWRAAGLVPVINGRMKSLEATIHPSDYPKPDHDRRRLVVACGMGVDSWAMLIEMKNRGIRPDSIQWADTGSERRHTYRAVGVLQAWLKRVGFPPLVVVRRRCPKAGHRSLFEQTWNTQQLPSPAFHMNHSCSVEWKLKPQRKWESMLGWLNDSITAIGFDAEEAGGRRGNRPVEAVGIEANEAGKRRSMRYAIDDSEFEQWYPLVEWGLNREDCLAIIDAEGLPRPGKSACFMCPVSKACELNTMEAGEIGPALALEQRFQDGPHFRGKYVGLASKRTWSEVMADGPAEVTVAGLDSDITEDPEFGEPVELVELETQLELFAA